MPKTTLPCHRRSPATSNASRPGRHPSDPSPSSSRRRRPNRLRAPTLSSSRRSKTRKPSEVLRRASSEPILWTVRPLLALNSDSDFVIKPPAVLLPRPNTCFDIFAPSPPPLLPISPTSWRSDPFNEGTKVVVSVTVEGSPGPVKAMVRLGASVEEAIAAVVDKYRRERRTPKIDQAVAAASFQLHHSCFSIESLSKNDKIGEVGGRKFYLRTSSEINNFYFGREYSSSLISGDNESRLHTDNSPAAGMVQSLLVLIITRLEKIGRKTKRLCRVVACISCI